MKKLIALLLFSNATAFAGTYIVELKAGFKASDIKRIESYSGIKDFSKFTTYKNSYFDRLYSLDLKDDKILSLIKNDKSVALIENDFEASYYEIRINKKSEMVTNDLLFPQQWGLYNQNQQIEKRSLGGYKLITKGASNVDINWKDSIDKVEANLQKIPVVAVVDMGIDFNHPELKDSIFKNMSECDENGEVPLEKVDHDDTNKLPADCHGWNFAATSPEFQFYPADDKGHGTHVSGIIAAKRDNDKGVSGVSDKIKILPIRVTGRVDETADKQKLLMRSPSKRIANGILYAVQMNVDVINLSLGWPKSMDTKLMRNVIAEAVSKGIVVVAAAGNDNSSASIYPCNYHDVICVGSIDADGANSTFSNYGGQVDILAPGDQIVSTIPVAFIPLKLNIQGYDIFSGTSQAAPFVSATAALIKASYPEISLDDVKRRLFSGARTRPDLTKSVNGLMNFSEGFEKQSGSLVLPVFKELSQAKVNPKNGIVQFPVFIKNYGDTEELATIKIESRNQGIEILNYNGEFKELAKGKPAAIYITARVKDFNKDHKFDFNLKINTSSNEEKLYGHSITLGLDMALIPKMEFGFRFKGGKTKPLVVRNKGTGLFSANLNTVDEKIEEGGLPSYYLLQNKTKTDDLGERGIKAFIFNFDGRGFSEAPNYIVVKNALKFLSISKHDYNYDGKKDILFKTIVCRKDCGRVNIPEEDLYIQYSYRTLGLEPLFGEYSDISYDNAQGISIIPKTVRYYKLKLPNGMTMAAPYFIHTGVIPKANTRGNSVKLIDEATFSYNDSNMEGEDLLNMFRPKSRSKTRRVYRLELKPGRKAFRARSFIDRNFVNIVRVKMKSRLTQRIAIDDTRVSILHMLSQDKEDYYADKVKAMISFGLGSFQYNVLMEINNGKYSIVPMDNIKQPLLGNSHYKFFNLESGVNKYSQNAFINFTTKNLMTITGTNKAGNEVVLPYRLDDKNDVILGFVGLFQYQNKLQAYIEQVDTLNMVTIENGVTTNIATPTQKFSFLPGQMMTESFYPVVVLNRENNQLEPAIYIDNTVISSDQVYVKTLKNNKFIAPIRSSFFIPKHCKSKNPVQGKDGSYMYTFLCMEKDGFKLKYINMSK